MKGMYSYTKELWRGQGQEEFRALRWQRLISWRKEPTVHRLDRPTRIDRARALGYKAKQGIFVVRVRVRRGGLRKPRPRMGRQPIRMGVSKITMKKSLKRIAEERAAKHYPNMEVLNSYFVAKDGRHKYFEVILADPFALAGDAHYAHLIAQRGWVYRGLTSEGRKNKGLRGKGKRSVHSRPSVNAGTLRGK
jgi:large subunit ribosomal protein L15e